ncbi:MAG: SAM-dependent methyltransferase [Halieaceae bacterium]|jgi:SAM-dependent methyltransferase
MKTFYEGHEALYQKKLAEGAPGWDSDVAEYRTHELLITKALANGHAPKTGCLLELGCGAGNIGLWFAQRGYLVSGIDIAPTAVALAQKRALELNSDALFSVGDVIYLEQFADDAFDFVYDSHLLHCIIGDDRRVLFDSIKRVLRPGGYFLVNTMCFSDLSVDVEGLDLQSGCTLLPDGTATRYIGAEEDILEELKMSHFKVLSHWREEQSDGHCLIVEATTAIFAPVVEPTIRRQSE